MQKSTLRPPSKLFALLRYLGVDQNTLAARLGVSHTLVSFWAHGKKPIPDKYKEALHTIIANAMDSFTETRSMHCAELLAAYKALPIDGPLGEETKAAGEAASQAIETFKATSKTLESMLIEWQIEESYLSGTLHRDLYTHCRALGQYGIRQPRSLTPQERYDLREAFTKGLSALRALERLDPTPTELIAQLKAQEPWRVVQTEEDSREIG